MMFALHSYERLPNTIGYALHQELKA